MKITGLSTMAGLAVLMAAPVYATPYCIAVGGGFGHGGTSFVGRNFTMPSANSCNPWTGYTKTATTVILMSSGVACLSTDGKILTVSVASADPAFTGAGTLVSDYIQLCPKGPSQCPITHGYDKGEFTGTADIETCTADLQQLPTKHD